MKYVSSITVCPQPYWPYFLQLAKSGERGAHGCGQTVIFETYFIFFVSYLYQTIGFVEVRISFSDLS